jgi:hypothetical protein
VIAVRKWLLREELFFSLLVQLFTLSNKESYRQQWAATVQQQRRQPATWAAGCSPTAMPPSVWGMAQLTIELVYRDENVTCGPFDEGRMRLAEGRASGVTLYSKHCNRLSPGPGACVYWTAVAWQLLPRKKPMDVTLSAYCI